MYLGMISFDLILSSIEQAASGWTELTPRGFTGCTHHRTVVKTSSLCLIYKEVCLLRRRHLLPLRFLRGFTGYVTR